MSGRPRGVGPVRDSVLHRDDARPAERLLELGLAGLVRDEDELLGNLAEGRAALADASGERVARRWWLGQALRAVPRLVWHGTAHRPLMALLGLAGFVVWAWLVSFAYGVQVVDAARPAFPPASQVIRETALVGVWNVLVAFVVGAVLAVLARWARLVPVLVASALMALISMRHAFYIVYGPGTCTMSTDQPYWVESCSIELGAWSDDTIVPVLWQLPTMMILLPLAATIGGLAVVAWTRRRASQAR